MIAVMCAIKAANVRILDAVHPFQTLIVYLLVNVIKNKQGKFQRMREDALRKH